MSADLKKKVLVILNDNKMSICPRVGGVASYLDRLRTDSVLHGPQGRSRQDAEPGAGVWRSGRTFPAHSSKKASKRVCMAACCSKNLGFRYIGPIDGHDIGLLRKYLQMVKDLEEPVLLHVVTEKGHGFKPAAEDPVFFHTPPAFSREADRRFRIRKSSHADVHQHRPRRDWRRDAAQRTGDGDDRRHVPGQQARTDSR